MKKQLFSLFAFLVFALTSAVVADAQTRAYRVTDNQVQTLLNRIDTRTDTYKGALSTAINSSANRDDSIFEYLTDFETATDSLKQRFDSRSSTAADVENVLGRANYIQDFMTKNRLTVTAQNQWRNISFDLTTLAGYYNVRWNRTVGAYPSTTYPSNQNNSTGGYNVTDREVQTLLNRLEVRTTDYRTAAQQRTNPNADSLTSYITDFERSSENLRRRFDSRSSNSGDVQALLSSAVAIDAYMRSNRLNPRAVNQWNLVRTDLNTLAGYYNVSWNWNNPPTYPNNPNNPTYPNNPPSTPFAGLNGTYRLNVRASDNLDTILDRAVNNNIYANNRDRIRENLERRLSPPEMLAIENVNRQFTLASSNSPQVTLTADGSTRTENAPNGRPIRIRAESVGNNVNISYEGDRTNDFYLTFEPLGTNQIRVTRKLYLENQNTQVSAVSVYDRTSSTAQWSEINNNNSGNSNNVGNVNEFYIPNGTTLTAVLTTPISTKNTTNGDRFTMEVRSPSQYQGAIIEGRVSNSDRSGRVSGRAALALEFEQIRLRNGRTYRFSGLIDSVKNANGDTVNINNEGVVRDGNQTTKTVTRAGIGAAVGAIIGAIAGGGSGAAIGAGIGAGAGAGSVILQGRDDLELNSGTEFNLTSSAPANLRTGQN